MKDNYEQIRERGLKFEADLAELLGMELVPGSGNQWHSKLDLSGSGFRGSLKTTKTDRYTIDVPLIDEAVLACESPGAGGETPFWGLRLQAGTPFEGEYDFVMLRAKDFARLAGGELKLPPTQTKAQARIERARKTVLQRLEEEQGDG